MLAQNETNSTVSPTTTPPSSGSSSDVSRGVWSQQEHDLFLEAMQLYPNGPWKAVADHVGTRSVRQVQTHAQKYHEKVARRLRGLRKDRKRVQRPEHRIDDEMLEICNDLQNDNALLPQKPAGKRQRKRQQEEDTSTTTSQVTTKREATPSVMSSHEESKLSESMQSVRFSEMGELDPVWGVSLGVPGEDDGSAMDPSFHECIDYLIEALSSSDSEYESS